MGKRGPAPTPTTILSLRGLWRAKTRSDDEVKSKGRPICPAWILPQAKKQWKKLVPQLDAMGLVGEIDGHILARYCQMWAQWRDAEEFLMANGFNEEVMDYRESREADGTIVMTPYVTGLRQYPQVTQARNLHKDMWNIERSFGMNPGARASLTVDIPKTKDQKKADVKKALTSNAG